MPRDRTRGAECAVETLVMHRGVDLNQTIFDDLANGEPLILLSLLRNDPRLGRRPDKCVPFRWRAEGLETVSSPRLATTWSSVLRFWARRSGVQPTAQPVRSSSLRRREIIRAERELASQGL